MRQDRCEVFSLACELTQKYFHLFLKNTSIFGANSVNNIIQDKKNSCIIVNRSSYKR